MLPFVRMLGYGNEVAPPVPIIEGKWEVVLESTELSTQDFGYCNNKDILYIFGGTPTNSRFIEYNSTLNVLNTLSNTYGDDSVLIRPRTRSAMCYLDNKVYMYGGTGTNGQEFYSYDIGDNNWELLSNSGIVGSRSRCKMVAVHDKVYLYGGTKSQGSNTSNTGDLYRYEPSTGTWESLANSQFVSTELTADICTDGEFIYAINGRYFMKYDIKLNVWETLISDISLSNFTGSICYANDSIYFYNQSYLYTYNSEVKRFVQIQLNYDIRVRYGALFAPDILTESLYYAFGYSITAPTGVSKAIYRIR